MMCASPLRQVCAGAEAIVVDPYDWLGLPKNQRPPNLYQLLGLDPSVADLGHIRSATDKQFRRVLPYLTGADALEAERLWSELEEARDTLLNPDRRAHYDATNSFEPSSNGSVAVESTEPQPESSDAPVSPEELNAASLPDPDPWWKSTPEASAKAEPWWKESAPDVPAPPPPPPPKPVAVATSSTAALLPTTTTKRPKSKGSAIPKLIIGLMIAGAIVAGIYIATNRKSKPTTPIDPNIAELPKTDPKTKQPDVSVAPKVDEPVPEVPLPKDFADQLRPKTFPGHAGAVNGLSVAASGSRFVSVGTDRTLRVWSVAKDPSFVRHTFASPAVGVAWCDRDHRIAAADGLTLALFESAKTTQPRAIDSPKSGVTCMAVNVDGSKALTGLTDGFIRYWDTNAGRFDEWAVAARGPINAVDISSDGTHALVAVADGPVSLWNLASRNRVHEWTAHPDGAIALRFAPNGKLAATGGAEGFASVYDLNAKKDVCKLEGHAGPITGIGWLPDGRQVVTVSMDKTARLWSAESGQALRWSQMLEGKGNCVAVDPGGRFVLAGTSTGNIHLFPLPRVRPELFTGAIGKPPAFPLAVPDAQSIAAALTPVHAELAREFGYNRPDDMALLADNLRRRASLERIAPPLRFALLQESRSLAVKAGDPVTAFRAIEDVAAWFDVDEMAEKAVTFAELPAEAESSMMWSQGLTAAERAELDARPEVVERLLKRIPQTLPDGTPAERVARLTAIRQRSKSLAAEIKAVRRALEVLKNAPDEPGSNHVLGAFLCFARQDWKAGLPHLAKGNDPRFIESAKSDLSSPTDPKAQHRLGEMWFGLAFDTKDHRAKRAMLGRARVWFERELKAKLEVADQIKARARLDNINGLDVPGKDPTTLPLFAPLHVRRAYNTIGGDVYANEWKFGGGASANSDAVVLPDGSPVMSSRFGLGSGGRLTLAFRVDGREIRINCAGQEFAFAGSGKAMQVTIERVDDSVTVTATSDDADPVSRKVDLPINALGPLNVGVRLSGTPTKPGGALLVSAIVRGSVSLPLPMLE
jgi:WD40 repeat protein